MQFEIFYTEKALGDLKKLDRSIAKRIIQKTCYYSEQKDLLSFAKPLKNLRIGKYRFRVGDYRILFDCDEKGNIRILTILRIKHRKDIYRIIQKSKFKSPNS